MGHLPGGGSGSGLQGVRGRQGKSLELEGKLMTLSHRVPSCLLQCVLWTLVLGEEWETDNPEVKLSLIGLLQLLMSF